MPHRIGRAAGLVAWAILLASVTWLDWLGLFTLIYGVLPWWIAQIGLVLVVCTLLVGLRAILRSTQYSRLLRIALVLGCVWLLLLPSIRWSPERALLLDSARLHIGMTKAQVLTIMADHRRMPPGSATSLIFCDDHDCTGTLVDVDLVDGRLAWLTIDMD